MSDHVLELMAKAATLAPSLHNSQPWRLRLAGDRLDIDADPARRLATTDPDGRWLHVACGAATLNAAVAGRALGYRCEIRLLPAGAPTGDGPLASIGLAGRTAPGPEDLPLARAVAQRHTDRRPFRSARPSPSLVDALRAAAAVHGCWTYVLTTRAEVAELSGLVRRAETAQHADPAYRAELRSWVRAPGTTLPDGIPTEALPTGPPDRGTSDVWLRDFTAAPAEVTGEPPEARHGPGTERPLVLVLGCCGDDPTAWLRAGMAMERVLLTATAAGIAGSPITQVLDLPECRAEFRRMVGIDGFPHMVLRLGYPAGPDRVRPTPRRAVTTHIEG